MNLKETILEQKLAVVGLGYVGLPLAVEFAKKRPVMGFDINRERVDELNGGRDHTLEISTEELKSARWLSVTDDLAAIAGCNVFIITVPTPLDRHNQPDLSVLLKASRMIATVLKCGDVVIYESTVYPGAIEEVCVPALHEASGLVYNQEFYVGYSPERVNPGDKLHRIANIKKITSGSTPEVADLVDALYNEVVLVGTYKARSIKVAEAAKVIENTQRDLNIALINELAIIFNKLGIDTEEVLNAAETKWNFLPFRPGLVGGHCIGVDPYYLTYKAQMVGYHPEIILAGRRLNDAMGVYIASQCVKRMIQMHIQVDCARVLVMGVTFKENCPDIRNTRVVEMIDELRSYGMQIDAYDPCAQSAEVEREYGFGLLQTPQQDSYDAIIVAVGHDVFRAMGAQSIRHLGKKTHVLYDVKHILPREASDMRL
jgi:UDP-N-acetyl-D-galactosamine dehydrogenase